MNIFGYHGVYTIVDATTGSSTQSPITESTFRRFPGGSALGTHLLLEHAAWQYDPLSAESSLVFAFSPLVGSPLTTSAKFAVVSRSPLTGRLNDSLASSSFALAGKRSGNDAILITGKSETPCILVIDDQQTRKLPADHLWGLSAEDAEVRLREQFSRDHHFAVIGPAGEQQVSYATISHSGRHAGRGGSGAVLGAKNVKAIVVAGNQRTQWADTSGLVERAKQLSQLSFGPATEKYRELGTAANLLVFNRLHCLPTRNFQRGSFANSEQFSPEALGAARDKTRSSCAACTIGCTHLYSIKSRTSNRNVRIEYENIYALGPLCDVQDPEAVLQASQRCDELGIDTISTGGTIAFAMECAERGFLDEPWLRFGDAAALLKAINLIGTGTGLGRLLRQGSRAMATIVGHNSIEFAPQVKGLEIPGYEPRALQTMSLGFAVGTRGADHNRSGAYEIDFSDAADRRNGTADAARLAVDTEDKAAIMDSLILCKFLRGVFTNYFAETAEILNLITGWDLNQSAMQNMARGIIDAKKEFNIRCGWTPVEDTLPQRMLTSALQDDPDAKLDTQTLQTMIVAYNLKRGWTADGYLDEMPSK
ncbi:MAG: aldehyde:ferredoxin oxidoreductase [Planctomycetaceae bacterium]|jgi:aldehyde:ferredoxin oxidoreductase|nr:aldehyde:ferredoxin oxidoreductase [Planctomycetaceae bacterium]MBT7255618.1 aldehyde:ferredoxin oxidoreductase [Planctomycetaceae bacterium]